MKKYIPGLYRVNEERLLSKLKNTDAVHMFEYERPGWTFHGKGAWLYEESKGDDDGAVTMTIIGSSNFSHRSNRRDTECQLYMLPECAELRRRLDEERQFMFSQASRVDLATVRNDGIDKINWKERLLNKLFRTFI